MAHALVSLTETMSMEYIKCFWKLSLNSWISLDKLCGDHMSFLCVSLFIMYTSIVSTGCPRHLREKVFETETKDKNGAEGRKEHWTMTPMVVATLV